MSVIDAEQRDRKPVDLLQGLVACSREALTHLGVFSCARVGLALPFKRRFQAKTDAEFLHHFPASERP